MGGIKELSQVSSRAGRSNGIYIYLKDTDQIITGLTRKERRKEASSPAHTVYLPGTLYCFPTATHETWCQEQAPLPLRCWEYPSSQGHREVEETRKKRLSKIQGKNSISKKMTLLGTRARSCLWELALVSPDIWFPWYPVNLRVANIRGSRTAVQPALSARPRFSPSHRRGGAADLAFPSPQLPWAPRNLRTFLLIDGIPSPISW